jgi:hypothetical protein
MIPVHAPVFHQVFRREMYRDAFHLDNKHFLKGIERPFVDDLPEPGIFGESISALFPCRFFRHFPQGLLVNIEDLNPAETRVVEIELALMDAADFGTGFCPDPTGFGFIVIDDWGDVIWFEE